MTLSNNKTVWNELGAVRPPDDHTTQPAQGAQLHLT